MPTYVSISKTDESRTEQLTSGQWQQIYFDTNNSKGTKGHHADGDWPSLLRGPVDYTGYISLRLSGVPVGVECKARAVEVTNKGDTWAVVERDRPLEFAGTSGDTFAVLPVAGHVAKNRRLRVEVLHYGDDDVTATVVAGEVRILAFER